MIRRERLFAGSAESGNAMVVVLLIGTIVCSLSLIWSQQVLLESKVITQDVARSQALEYAESGINLARLRLKGPDIGTYLPSGSSQTLSAAFESGGAEVAMHRVLADTSLVELYATGYYHAQSGSQSNAQGKKVKLSVVRAVVRITNAGEYAIAVPGELSINPGTDLSAGRVYAGVLNFVNGSGIQISEAYYYTAATPSDAPSFVQWVNPYDRAIRLSFPPAFPAFDDALESFYQDKSTADPLPAFSGTVGAPSDGRNVYYSPGSIDIGYAGPLQVDGAYVLYVAGDVRIHNSVRMANSDSTLVIMAEGDVVLSASVPDALQIQAFLITNQNVRAEGTTMHTGGELRLEGGIVCHRELLNLSRLWPSRRYMPRPVNNNNLLLPYFTELVQYRIITSRPAGQT